VLSPFGRGSRPDSTRGIESRAAANITARPRSVPRRTNDPQHWLTFGPRHSPLTGGPRLSVNPANSLINFTTAVAESECRLAACACGLDPALGFLHTDTVNRDSLALDLIETIRPAIESWILDWLMSVGARILSKLRTGIAGSRVVFAQSSPRLLPFGASL
jgi:hypothetical protein